MRGSIIGLLIFSDLQDQFHASHRMALARYRLSDAAREELQRLVKKKRLHPSESPFTPPEDALRLQQTLRAEWSRPRCRFYMRDFEHHRTLKDEWESESFYYAPPEPRKPGASMPGAGYKLQLGIYANGCREVEGAISVFVYLLEGEYDDSLHWPVEVNTTVQLHDRGPKHVHITKTITLQSDRDRRSARVKPKKIKGKGRAIRFATYSGTYLPVKYFENDEAWFEVTTVSVRKL